MFTGKRGFEVALFHFRPNDVEAVYQIHSKNILYEDNALIVVHKPSGLPTQPTLDPQRDNLFYAVQRYVGKNGYVGLHHRLDVGTSGPVLMTKMREVNAAIAEDFKERRIHKQYCALSITKQNFEKDFEIRNYIGELKGSKPQKFGCVTKGGKFAHSICHLEECISLKEGLCVDAFFVTLLTGRTHQIRVHLSHAGAPVIGDHLYGTDEPLPRSLKAILPNRLCLHSCAIAFRHPLTRQEISVQDPIPDEFLRFLKQCRRILSR